MHKGIGEISKKKHLFYIWGVKVFSEILYFESLNYADLSFKE